MPQDNTLGAPTEGLGQTVTFGFSVPGSPALSTPVQRGRLRGGVQGQTGGGISQARGVQAGANGTMEMLMKVGEGLIDKQIKETRAAAFVTGMQRAMSGEAVEDIAKDQPAWSRVFGDSDAVEGARTYSTEASVQRVMLNMESDMDSMRKMGPAEANTFFTEAVKGALTGNPATDGAIMSAVQRNMPAVMKRQASAHYAYMQEKAASDEANAIDVAAERLQNAGQSFANGILTKDDFEEQQASVGALSVPAIGRDLKHVQQQRTASAVLMAEKGQFHALNAMDKVGMFELLTPQQRSQIQRSRDANEIQWRTKYGVEFQDRIATLRNLAERPVPGWDGNAMMAAVNDMNKDYKARTGSNADYFDPNIVAAYGERTAQAIKAAQDHQKRESASLAKAAADLGDKAGAARINQGVIEAAMADGTLGNLSALTDIKADDINRAFAPVAIGLFNKAITADAADFGLIARSAVTSNYVNPVVANTVRGMVLGAVNEGGAGPGFINVFEGWRKLNAQSKEAASMYYGELDAKFRRFATLHPGPIDGKSPDPNVFTAFNVSFGTAADSTRGKLGSATDMAALAKTVTKELTFMMPEAFGGQRDLQESMANALADKVKPFAELYGKVEDQETAFKLGLKRAQQLGLNVVGGYFWQDAERPNLHADLQKRMGGKFAIPTGEEFGVAVGNIIDDLIEKAGGMAVPVIHRQGDMLVIVGQQDGAQHVAQIEYNALAEQVMNATQKDRKGASTWWRFGPKITYTPDPKAPSIYAGPDEWAKYRSSQGK